MKNMNTSPPHKNENVMYQPSPPTTTSAPFKNLNEKEKKSRTSPPLPEKICDPRKNVNHTMRINYANTTN